VETQPAKATRMAVAAAVGNWRKDGNMAVDDFLVRCSRTRLLLRKFPNYLRVNDSTYLGEILVDNLRFS